MVDPLIAKRVQLVGLDVDGVMTDGGVYVGTAGGQQVELKRFDIRDNIGIRFLRAAGIKVVVVSGRYSDATRLRAEELGVEASGGCGAVREFAAELLRARGQWEDVMQRYLAERGDPAARGISAG